MKKQILIGVSIILLAVVIILLAVFAPRWARKREMGEILDLMLLPDPQAVVLSDPLFDTDDPLHDGKEMVLGAKEAAYLTEKLSEMLEGGYRFDRSEKQANGAWEISLSVRTALGENCQIFLGVDEFYYTENGVAHYFIPRDKALYLEFLQSVNIFFAAK